MAKLEDKTKKLKRKAKKRQHEDENQQQDSLEIAAKSFIIESEEVAPTETVKSHKKKDKSHKRKVTEDSVAIKLKRTKPTEVESSADEAADKEDDVVVAEQEDNDGDTKLPTREQLRECEKPENINAVVTVRQKKKQKHAQRLEALKDQSGDKELKRNREYLQKWKTARADWKFEKLRQISIQQSIFDETKIDETLWSIALEYLSGSKGAAKDKITKLADDVIEQLDKEAEAVADEAARQTIVESARYQRARQLLQSF